MKDFSLKNFVPYAAAKPDPVFFSTVNTSQIRFSMLAIKDRKFKYALPMYSTKDQQIALEMFEKAAENTFKVTINSYQAVISCAVFLRSSDVPAGRYRIGFEAVGKRRFMVLTLVELPVETKAPRKPAAVKSETKQAKSGTKPAKSETVRAPRMATPAAPSIPVHTEPPGGFQKLPANEPEHRGAMTHCTHPGDVCKPAFCNCRCKPCLTAFLSGKPLGEAA